MNSYSLRIVSRIARAGLMLASSLAPLLAASDITGRVSNAAGDPLTDAKVFVYTAAPKVGTSALCPSCYPDCGKTAKTDSAGNFVLPGLSSQLHFQLLVVAPGYAPKFVPKVELDQPPLDIGLAPRRNADAPAVKVVRGRVVDTSGAPIHGAVIDIDGVALDGGRQHFGGLTDTDPLAVTDEAGEFVLMSGMPALALLGRISARNFANQSVQLETGKTHTLTLSEGATLKGRVMLDGKPVPHVVVGVSPQDRRAGSFVGNFEIGTDAEGRFHLPNLPPKTDYTVFGKMETLGRYGSIPSRSVHVGRDGEATDIGEIKVQSARRLAGRVVLEDGATIPEKTRLAIARDRVSDLLSVELAPDGTFDVPGIPSGVIALSVRVPGYQISTKNRSYDPANRRVIGKLEDDFTDLQLLMEKGPPPLGPIQLSSLPLPPQRKPGEHPRDQPLHGIESSP